MAEEIGITVFEGQLTEGPQFDIVEDYHVGPFGTRCRHCIAIDKSHPKWVDYSGSPDPAFYDHQAICPMAVVATVEGSHTGTAVCLNCIVEAEAELGPKGV